MNKPILSGEEILRIIPQRAPIVMIDRFFGINEEQESFSGLTVGKENFFCRDGLLQEEGIIEHIAQSAAARIGYLCSLQNEPVPLGFIGSVDKLRIHRLPPVGSELITKITVIQEVFDITLIAAQVKENDECIAEGKMKIVLKKES